MKILIIIKVLGLRSLETQRYSRHKDSLVTQWTHWLRKRLSRLFLMLLNHQNLLIMDNSLVYRFLMRVRMKNSLGESFRLIYDLIKINEVRVSQRKIAHYSNTSLLAKSFSMLDPYLVNKWLTNVLVVLILSFFNHEDQ